MITIQKRIKLYESMILNIKENKCFGLQDEKILNQIIFTNFSFEGLIEIYDSNQNRKNVGKIS